MSKKKSRRKRDRDEEMDADGETKSFLQEETFRIIYAIIFFIIAIFLVFSFIGQGNAGPAGIATDSVLNSLFGIGRFLLPILLSVLGIIFLRSEKRTLAWPKLLGAFVFLVAALGIISAISNNSAVFGGGILGNTIARPLVSLFDFWVTLIFLLGLLVISTVVIFDNHLSISSLMFWKRDEEDELTGKEDAAATESLIKGIDPIPEENISVAKTKEPVIASEKDKKNESGKKKQGIWLSR